MLNVCEILGTKYPIIQGAMARIAEYHLAAAVSNGGGLGIIAAGGQSGDWLKDQIKKTREMTDKPFGVNIMLMADNVDELVEVVCEEKVPVVTTGAGNPGKYIAKMKEHGIKVIPVVANVTLALRVERAGADAVVAEGTEAGGHLGTQQSIKDILPDIVKAVNIPVIAAGGATDGAAVAELLKLGASGVQMGSRFAASEESNGAPALKELYLKMTKEDVVQIDSPVGYKGRAILNPFAKQVLEGTQPRPRTCDNCLKQCSRSFCIIRALTRAQQGDVETGLVFTGANMWKIKEILPVKEIFRRLKEEIAKI